MYNFIRGLLQRENKIIKYVAIAVFVLIFLNLLNKRYGQINEERIIEENKRYGNYTVEEIQEKNDVVADFINYCKNKDYNSAYQMVSEECKTSLYPTLEHFEENYCKEKFEELNYFSRSFVRVINDITIYEITFKSNSIETGLLKTENDYIGVYNEKINLSGFLNTEKIERTLQDENFINVKIKNKYNFYDCEIFDVEIINETSQVANFEMSNIKGTIKEITYPNINPNEKITIQANDKKSLEVKFIRNYDFYETESISILNIELGEEKIDIEINLK